MGLVNMFQRLVDYFPKGNLTGIEITEGIPVSPDISDSVLDVDVDVSRLRCIGLAVACLLRVVCLPRLFGLCSGWHFGEKVFEL